MPVGSLVVLLIALSLALTAVVYVAHRAWAQLTCRDHLDVLNGWSSIATIVGAILAVGTLLAGLITYNLTTQYQNRAEATSTFQSYAAVRVEHPRPEMRTEDGKLNHRYGWIAIQAFAASENIYLANPEDEGGVLTAQDIIDDRYVRKLATNQAWEDKGWFKCEYYNLRFISEVVEARLGDGVCEGPVWRTEFGI